MASSVFYKFKNSKEPERIVFDGTGISVFELKREIITASGLGDGTDFDLHIYPEDSPKEEYDDDTTIISRSSTVIAVRRPAARGHGRAARYVSGRAPVRAIKKADTTKPITTATAGIGLSEADAEAAFLAESAQAWDQQKEALSHAKPVYHKKKPVNIPTHDPPPGYICYRCQKKGHWIQACPTNDDPDFKPVPRAKRTTGIPRSFLQTIAKPTEDELEDSRGIMLNSEGEYVKVLQDERTWKKFQEKANASKAQAANVDAVNKEIRERGLECSIDKRLFVDPVQTPCCSTTYCHDCIENALADGDLVCPNCSTEGVLIDDLTADEGMVEKIRAFEAEKAKEKVEKEQQAKDDAKAAAKPSSPSNNESVSVPHFTDETAKASKASASGAGGNNSDTDTSSVSKKRKSPPSEIKPPTAPKAMRAQKEQAAKAEHDQMSALEKQFFQNMAELKDMPTLVPPVSMGMSMGMPMNPMMGYGGGWNQNQSQNQYAGNMGYQQNMPNNAAPFPNQQRTVFSEQPNEKDAYERKPLNPQRSQNRNRRQRPTDYHYV
ncbi:DWNN-domain-containing protein [Lindgomyces ingoldianus]|uniref:DWNN-domain-containing protein n=1 Tax=Lindgomyces ingoldianus TaxID=673940 RepID=A0ACB6RIR4_9PLEO|nr:DWNN-domain-containing protein [Lindgomyces ingoldianus]KAF2478222.1 DWNN-domain-containing protein [Lindgomyces ingoldianus]